MVIPNIQQNDKFKNNEIRNQVLDNKFEINKDNIKKLIYELTEITNRVNNSIVVLMNSLQ